MCTYKKWTWQKVDMGPRHTDCSLNMNSAYVKYVSNRLARIGKITQQIDQIEANKHFDR